jgi:hypothetical protein
VDDERRHNAKDDPGELGDYRNLRATGKRIDRHASRSGDSKGVAAFAGGRLTLARFNLDWLTKP